MSARAAARLHTLGVEHVLRYTAGKMDWFAGGLPREGTLAAHPRVGDVARRDVPTCRLGERLTDIAPRVRGGGWELCVIVDDHRIVLGLVEADQLAADGDVAGALRSGPTTFRPHLTLEETLEYLNRLRRDSVLVTTSDGELIGLARRADVERRVAEHHARAEPPSS